MRRSLTRQERLRRSRDIRELFSAARRVEARGLKLLYRSNGGPGHAVRGRRCPGMRGRGQEKPGEADHAGRHIGPSRNRSVPGIDLVFLVVRFGAALRRKARRRWGSCSAARACEAERIEKAVRFIAVFLITVYQKIISPAFPPSCRYRSHLLPVRKGSDHEARFLQGIVPRRPETAPLPSLSRGRVRPCSLRRRNYGQENTPSRRDLGRDHRRGHAAPVGALPAEARRPATTQTQRPRSPPAQAAATARRRRRPATPQAAPTAQAAAGARDRDGRRRRWPCRARWCRCRIPPRPPRSPRPSRGRPTSTRSPSPRSGATLTSVKLKKYKNVDGSPVDMMLLPEDRDGGRAAVRHLLRRLQG